MSSLAEWVMGATLLVEFRKVNDGRGQRAGRRGNRGVGAIVNVTTTRRTTLDMMRRFLCSVPFEDCSRNVTKQVAAVVPASASDCQ